ncbi:MAG: ATP-binding protein [Thermodesulfobacteriota bacterium]
MTFLSLYAMLSNIPFVYPLYFFYGAAFLFLGISISVKDLKGSDLKIANILWMLGMFGLVHGAYEWFQLYPLIHGEYLSRQDIFLVNMILLFLLILSFFFLLQFGVLMLVPPGGKGKTLIKGIPALVALAWAFILWNQRETIDLLFLWQAEIGIRYTLGLTGGLVTGYGLISYSREIKSMSQPMGRSFFYSGVVIAVYGFLAGVYDLIWVLKVMHLPVELLRGVSAFFLSYFIIKALNIFNIETRQKVERQTRLLYQTEKLFSLGQMAAGIAHEINNPLTNASLVSQTLQARLKSHDGASDMVEKLAAVEKYIDRASAIAQELLLFSRQKEPEMVPLNLIDTLEGSLTLLRFRFKNIVLRKDLAPVPTVMGDPGKLEQVFVNILSNSLEAMPEGGTLTVASSGKNGRVEIRLSDTGSGIAEKDLPQVFDPFFTTKDVGEGTGLGLSICYGIIKQHRGDIEISNAKGRGTTVTVTLPAKEPHEKDSDRRR